MKRFSILLICLLAFSTLLMSSKDPSDDKKEKKKKDTETIDTSALSAKEKEQVNILVNLTYQSGTINIPNLGSIKVPAGFKFLNAAQSDKVLYNLWGNPKSYDPEIELVGMIFPEQYGPVGDSSWAFVVQYEKMGYVKDDDAAKIDYAEMKKQIQSGEEEENKTRVAAGSVGMHFVDWAETPYYDKDKKVLYWAKNFKVDGSEVNTLNYDIRVLGRKGIMSLQAVAGMDMLPEVDKYKGQVLSMVEFESGNKYSDFNSGTDKVAAWTIGGLVAGKILAKVGFFAIFLKYIKLILLAVGGGFAAIWRFITGKRKKKEEDSLAYVHNTTDQA